MKKVILSLVIVTALIAVMLPVVTPSVVLADVPEYYYVDEWNPSGDELDECRQAGELFGCCEAASAIKIEGWVEVEGGMDDTYGPIAIWNSGGYSFSWISTQLVTCVIIKAGQAGHIFSYCPDGEYGGSLDIRDYLPAGEPLHAISHVTFCFGAEIDALIFITPPDATNPVGDDHVLTALVLVDYDDGRGFVPYQDATVTFEQIGDVGTLDPEIAVTNSSGQAVTTLTSNIAGTSIVQASTTIEIDGKEFHLVTDEGVCEYGGPARKIWVGADINIVKTADPTVVSEAGTVVTYDYVVTNTGDVTLTGIEVTDDRLGGITLDETELDPGESTSGTAEYTVTQADINAGDDIVNIATVTCDQGVTDQDDATVTIVTEGPEIKIVKTADPTVVSEAGTVVTYDYVVTNTGDVTLTGIEVTDDRLGGITLDETELDPGESTSGTAEYTVTQADINAGDDIVNIATVTCDQGVTDQDDARVTVTRRPPPPTTCTCCYECGGLTVDWEGYITTKPLYCSNDKLAVDCLAPSFDLSHNLFLERGTHAPVVYQTTHYLIVVRELEETPSLPENMEAVVVFHITPANAEFDKDIFLTLGVAEVPANAINVTMAYYDDINGVWELMESEAGGPSGVAELTLSAPINHFSIYGVLAELEPTPPPQPARFTASGLNIEPTVEKLSVFVTKTGESVTITANVANDGGQGDTYTVELKLNGEAVDTEIVTLGAGQSKQVSFTVSELEYGQYEVEVAGLADTFTTSRTIAWWLIIIIIAAVGLIIWGVVWGTRRKRKTQLEG